MVKKNEENEKKRREDKIKRMNQSMELEEVKEKGRELAEELKKKQKAHLGFFNLKSMDINPFVLRFSKETDLAIPDFDDLFLYINDYVLGFAACRARKPYLSVLGIYDLYYNGSHEEYMIGKSSTCILFMLANHVSVFSWDNLFNSFSDNGKHWREQVGLSKRTHSRGIKGFNTPLDYYVTLLNFFRSNTAEGREREYKQYVSTKFHQ